MRYIMWWEIGTSTRARRHGRRITHTHARARANERTDDNGNDEVAVDIEEVLGEVARNKDADEDEKGSGEKLDE